MSLARRWILFLLILCIPLQSMQAVAGTTCDSMSVAAGSVTMPMLGHHDHAAMLATQHAHADAKTAAAQPMNNCGHCAHCPACLFSACNTTLSLPPIVYSLTPDTVRSDDVLISLVLDTPQRPPQTA